MRIPVFFGAGTEQDVHLVESGETAPDGAYFTWFAAAPAAGHLVSCTCCAPRGAAAAALAALFRARATGKAPLFNRVAVTASAAGRETVRQAMSDVVVASRFRLEVTFATGPEK